MTSEELRHELTKQAKQFADSRDLKISERHASAVIFMGVLNNLHPESARVINDREDWRKRTAKPHQNVADTLEMQSSNSSDALLMSIFCHPAIGQWRGVRNLLNVERIEPEFGFKPRVKMDRGARDDTTEIDMKLTDAQGNPVYVEAKLTEGDFSKKDNATVERYDGLEHHYHTDKLPHRGDNYLNYQIIRNLLAAEQNSASHILLCDERRADLVRSYMETVCCLKNVELRAKCRVVFWQDIARSSGADLKVFLADKYGMR